MIFAVHGDTVSSLFLSFLSYIYGRENGPKLGWLLCGGCKVCGQNNTQGTIFGSGLSRRKTARCSQQPHGGVNIAGSAHPTSSALSTGGERKRKASACCRTGTGRAPRRTDLR